MNSVLPNMLTAGTLLVFPDTGRRAVVVTTRGRDAYHQQLYRLRYPRQRVGGVMYPEKLGRDTYSRDQLQEMGAQIKEVKRT